MIGHQSKFVLFLKQLPLPVCGVTLGVAALGNLLLTYSKLLYWGYGMIAALLWLFLVLKILLCWEQVKQELANPLSLSVFEAFFMTLLQLAIYIEPYFSYFAFLCWVLANIGHVGMVFLFSQRYLHDFQLSTVYATWNVLYGGNMLAAVVAPLFHMEQIGLWIFWIGFFLFLPWYPISAYRYWKLPVAEEALPTLCILAAPFHLSLTAYLSCTAQPSVWLSLLFACIAQGMYLFVLMCLPRILKTSFSTSYGALTFPFVIPAVALQKLFIFLTSEGIAYPQFLHNIVLIEQAIAVIMVTYALIRYILYFSKKIKYVFIK